MNLLLDTHIFIWWILDDERLTPAHRQLLINPTHRLFLSVVSVWEILTKAQIGRLELNIGSEMIPRFISEQIQTNQFNLLPIQFEHVAKIWELPLLHRDPFDRLLIAQSICENLLMLTEDSKMRLYPVQLAM